MFSNIASIKKPRKGFNLYHLEGSEIHVLMIKVRLLLDNLENEVEGALHLCSRSLFFEPNDIAKPLFKLKFSNPFIYKVAEKTDKIKLRGTILPELKEQGLATTEKKSFYLQLDKLYEGAINSGGGQLPSPRNKSDRPLNALIITAEKIYTTIRNPISPYSSERINIPLIFELTRENQLGQINKFLKALDYVIKYKNEDNLTKILIDTHVNEGLKEILESPNHQKSKRFDTFKARRIVPEGIIYGAVTVNDTEELVFYPLVNKGYQKLVKLQFSAIMGILKYRYMFKHTAIEIWSYNKKNSVLLDFYDEKIRETVFNHLKKYATKKQDNLFSRDYVTGLWLNGHLSNFEYLMFLNTIGNRSFNDLSQYPIFPWVISDFHSEKLNFNNPDTFRDLSRPMGAINKSRLQRFKDGYEDQLKSKFEETPYLYPTHYSTPGFVVYFLIRKIPEFIIKLQNGVFGPAERIVRSFEGAWDLNVNQGPDLKELIPEFYSLDPDFLVNFEKILLGVTPEGEVIDDVLLPQWAKNASDFLQKMRAALECDYVSANIHNWIDLIFGYKQTGDQATASNNLFYPLCYEHNVDWSKIKSANEKEAIEIQVAEFGQIPTQVFTTPHPQKRTRLINIYKVSKESAYDDIETLKAKLENAVYEIMELKKETERLKIEENEVLRRQGEDFRKKEEMRAQEILRKISEKEEEIEALKAEIHNLKERASLGGMSHDDNAIAKLKKEYEEKIARLQAQAGKNEYIQELENANTYLKKKVRNYEEAFQGLQKDQQKQSSGGRIFSKKGYDVDFNDI